MKTFNPPSLCLLALPTGQSFDQNLAALKERVTQTPDGAIIVAPEVVLTGFAYERMEEAAAFSAAAIPQLQALLSTRLLILTILEQTPEGAYLNTALALTHDQILHRQSKYALFPMGNEERHFIAGTRDAITPFTFNGLSIGILICFELRFTDLWRQLRGADLIAVPAFWGLPRKSHFQTLLRALALTNQCTVLGVCSTNPDMAGWSALIDAWGVEESLEGDGVLHLVFDPHPALLARRALPLS